MSSIEAMQSRDRAGISIENGIRGDFRGTQRGRQVTLLSVSQWHKACEEVGADLPWTTRRANLLLDGIEFDESFIGKTVTIGKVELLVTRETNPCALIDAQHQGLTAALTPEWRDAICCNVAQAGQIKIGARVEYA